jgi:hypothetical protein
MYHYGHSGYDSDFEQYYLELAANPDKCVGRTVGDEGAMLIAFPRIMGAIAATAMFLSAIIILVHVTG